MLLSRHVWSTTIRGMETRPFIDLFSLKGTMSFCRTFLESVGLADLWSFSSQVCWCQRHWISSRKWQSPSCSQYSEQSSHSLHRWCFGQTELFFNSAASGSVQPINQKAIRGGASGEDDPNFRLVPAFNRSISSSLKITRRRQEEDISKEMRRHLADSSLLFTWWPDELEPSVLASPWKHISWLRTCYCSLCKLPQKAE